jgi:hypothetical protein
VQLYKHVISKHELFVVLLKVQTFLRIKKNLKHENYFFLPVNPNFMTEI